jgi:arginine-tRNA-protein transferase
VKPTANNLQETLDRVAYPLGHHSHLCGYFKDREATDQAWLAHQLDPELYTKLMDLRFRRSGQIIYRPTCESCDLCIPIRIPVAEFKPSRSQRKAISRNRDVSVTMGKPELTAEKHAVYESYLDSQHGQTPQGSNLESMRDFLYSSCVDTVEVCYRDANDTLLGASILDVSKNAISSVYHYFNPEHAKRSMGVFSALSEIQLTNELGRDWYYLGFWIKDCAAMDYKHDYQPNEKLIDGKWVRSTV